MKHFLILFIVSIFARETGSAQISATTQAADLITTVSARMNGTTNADGTPATVRFLYGTLSGAYVDSVTADQSPITTDNISTPVTATISGLTPGTMYYFRLRTTDIPDGGVAFVTGAELSFTTLPGVTAVSPAQQDLHIASTTTIQITFSEAMLTSSFDEETSFIVSGRTTGRHAGPFDFTSGNTVATFTPTVPFAKGEIVFVQLTNGLQTGNSEAVTPFTYSFTTAVGVSPGTFGTATVYNTGNSPVSLFLNDVNRDGYADITVARASDNAISVLTNNGNGTFATPVNYTVGNFAIAAFVADVNHDGYGDLVVANANSSTVSVLLNNGDGTFAATIDYPTGSSPASVSVADLDGDGHNDIVTANQTSGSVSFLRNNGDGTFAVNVDYAAGSAPSFVFVSDLNGNGFGDVVATNKTSNTISVLMNNGDETLAAKVDYATELSPSSLFISDIDGDGDGDIVVSHVNSDNISVYKNEGNGVFAARVNYSAVSSYSVAIGDVDGDGHGDIIATSHSNNTVAVLLNNGDGTFAPKSEFGTGGSFPYFVSFGDVDNDGDGDIAVANLSSGSMTILKNEEIQPTATTNAATSVAFGNATLNGTANANGFNLEVRFLYGTSPGTYADSIAAAQSPLSGSSDTPVSASLTALTSGTTYYYRVAVESATAYVRGSEGSFLASNSDSVPGYAVQLDGVDDRITTGKTLGQLIGSAAVKTVMAWIKPTGTSPTGGNVYNGDGIIADDAGYWGIYRSVTGGLDRIWVYNWSGGPQTVGIPYTNNEWMHVTMVHFFGNLYAYKNGVLVGSTTTGVTDYTAGAVFIGGGFGGSFEGAIDEITMWGVVLTAEQIRERMHTTINSAQSGLTVNWQFNEGSGTAVQDIIGGHQATIVNTTSPWILSTIPVGKGTSASVTSFTGGTTNLGSFSLTTTENFDNAVDLTATMITVAPNTVPAGYPGVVGNTYVLVNAFGTPGTFAANVSINFGAGVLDEAADAFPGRVKLFRRNSNSAGAWTEIGGATSANSTTGVVTWDGITSFSQFAAVYDESSPTVQPGVTAVSPAQHALNIASTTTVQITLSEAMLPASFNDTTSFIVSGVNSGRHRGTIVLSNGDSVAMFTPDVPFASGERVIVQLTDNIQTAGSIAIAPYFSSFTVIADVATGSFENVTGYITGDNPLSVSSADIDMDGDMDIVLVNRVAHTVSIYKNNGDGTFAGKVDYATGFYPRSVTLSDLDGDGDIDLAVISALTESSNHFLSVLLNNGDGTYAARVNYALGAAPNFVTHSDLDGDGDVDLVVTYGFGQTSPNVVSIFMNNGDGTFAANVDYATGTLPYSAVCSDLDGDGDIDLVVNNYSSGTISVLLNNGDGTFAAKVDYSAGVQPVFIASADYDGDGDADVAVIDPWSDKFSILKNMGDGTFAGKVDYPAMFGARALTSADVDGDGDLDIAMVSAATPWSIVSIFNNNGDGTFAARVNYGNSGGLASVASADFDKNGTMDLATANTLNDTLFVLLNLKVLPVSVSPLTLNFGTAVQHAARMDSIVIRNTDTQPLTIAGVTSSSSDFTLTQGDTTIAAGDSVTYYITFAPATFGSKSGTITIAASGYASIEVALSGTDITGEPTVAPSSALTTVAPLSATVTWTNGNGSARIVVMKQGSSVNSDPVDGTTYTAAATFGSGTQIGTGNYVVSSNNGIEGEQDSVTVVGLQASTEYHFIVAEFNGSGGSENYLTSSVLSGSILTSSSNFSTALSFDGVNDYVDIPVTTSPTAYTIEMWVKPFSTANAVVFTRTDFNGAALTTSHALNIHNGKFEHYTYNQAAGTGPLVLGSTTIVPETWYHVAITALNGGMIRLFINGVEEGTAQPLQQMWTDGTTYQLGPNGAYAAFFGLIDELRIWDNARTAVEIAGTNGAELTGSESGLIGYWKCNEGSGTTIADATVNAVTGTLLNGVGWAQFESPLPVQLVSFTATSNRLHAELKWETATETNNYGFEIERRRIGIPGPQKQPVPNNKPETASWSTVGFVQGSGTSNAPKEYSFTELLTTPGRYAYRIKQIDHDGTFEYYHATELEIGLMPKTLELFSNYPNPFNPTTNIEFTLPENGRAVLKVFDVLGREVATLFDGEAEAGRLYQTTFDARRMATGLYFSRMEFQGQYRLRKMMVVK